MINDKTYHNEESELQQLFAEAGWYEKPLLNKNRIDSALDRAISEQVSTESISFVFNGFSSVISSFAHTFLTDNTSQPEDYRL